MQMWLDMCSTLAVAAAARLGIADVLATSSPQESAALARAVGADAMALTRLLRTLVSLGILAQPHPHTYALTSLGAVLRSDHPDSMRDLLIAVTDTPHVQAWGKLHESVSSGQPSVPALFGMPIFAYYAVKKKRINRIYGENCEENIVAIIYCPCGKRRGVCSYAVHARQQ